MRERIFLGVLSAAMAAGLALFLADPQPRQKPSDKAAFEKTVEQALDSNSPQRFALWRAAREQVVLLDPNRPAAASAFVRSGLFHWYELGEADRQSVIAAIEPLLYDQAFFDAMAQPLFQLTGDFKVLRRANPGNPGALGRLEMMAVMNGHFADYRHFREQVRKRQLETFALTRKTATAVELVELVPIHPTVADKPLMQGILDELSQRPLDTRAETRHVDPLIDFALDHDLHPLEGIEGVVRIAGAASDPQRARLAVRLGQLERASDIEAASPNSDRAPWNRYYIERALEEMRRHEALAAWRYLQKTDPAKSPDAIAASEEIQRMAGNTEEATAAHAMLISQANEIGHWTGKCGDDICDRAGGIVWSEGARFAINLLPVQSDEVPPYAEVYVDDALIAEGPVSPELIARTDLLRGIHRIDVSLANPMTRNMLRRRIRVE